MICSVLPCDVALVEDAFDLDMPAGRLGWARERAGYLDKAEFAKAAGVNPTTYRAYENGQNGFAKLAASFAKLLGVSAEWLLEGGPQPDGPIPSKLRSSGPTRQWAGGNPQPDLDVATVEIQHTEQAFGLGGAFSDSYTPERTDLLRFPRQWVETITYSPPELLTWTRGRGDSMRPTIEDGDLVLLDRSHRKVTEQDALWAFAVGDVLSIKRLRVKGDRYQIFSDNSAVKPDEEPQDFVTIIGRVVFVGRRL